MSNSNNMNMSSVRGIYLSITLLVSIGLIIIPSTVYAEEISVQSFALDETAIIEVANESDKEIDSFRVWLGGGISFKSFKTEEGWTGENTQQGTVIFTSSESVKPGESVKFGVKTDKVNSGVNWKALDKEGKQIDIGKVLPSTIQTIEPKNASQENIGTSMSDESIFRIIPEKPNAGSSIRVTGDKFGASQEFDFYVDAKKIGSFLTDEDGHFMTTMKIPSNQKAERIDFKIMDKAGEEKKISLRIGEIENRIPVSDNIKLTIQGMPEIVHRGDSLDISGTAQPNSAVTAKITNSEGEIINTTTAEVDSKGNWKPQEQVIISLDAPFGDYSAVLTDGREEIDVEWRIESNKVINVAPSDSRYEAGETMKFEGGAVPNKSLDVVLEDPLGKEIFSDIIQVNGTGDVKFEYTTEQTSLEGTYTVVATQEKHKEFIFVGLGQSPTIPVNLEFDKLNYKSGETAVISLIGKASDIVSLLVIDPSDKPTGDATSITLQPDGRGIHSIKLDGYSSGVYTAVISKGNAQSTEIFTVGLQTGSGGIEIKTTKTEYHPKDPILILGDTSPNVLLDITMMDPDENVVRIKETFSDKNGKISESSFRIPSDAKSGAWTINAKSGPNFHKIEIEVLQPLDAGLVIEVTEGDEIPGFGKTLNIHVLGAAQTVEIEIIAEDGKVVETLQFPASGAGEINQPWIPRDMEPGIYTIKVTDAFNSAETTFQIE